MKSKEKAFCEYCGKEEHYSKKTENEEVVVRGVKFTAPVTHCFCENCKNEILVNDEVDCNLKITYEIYKKKMGMVTGEQIRALREKHGLSAVSLSRLIGAGDKTVTRYENGSIQDPVFDRIFHLLMSQDGFCSWLEANRSVLTDEEYDKILNKHRIYDLVDWTSHYACFFADVFARSKAEWKNAEKMVVPMDDTENAKNIRKPGRA